MTAPGLVSAFVGGPILPYDAAELAAHIKALADPARLQLLAIITNAGTRGISGIGAIEALGRLSQPTIAHHLRILEAYGFVRRERDGAFVCYTVNRDTCTAVAAALRGAR